MRDQVRPFTALLNGLRRNCPHCGRGALLDGWLSVRHACPDCGFVYERTAGDTWAFWVVGDRIPVGAAIIAVYFFLAPQTRLQTIAFLAATGAALVATIPHRLGFVTALDYLCRRYWPDPEDTFPPLPLSPHAGGKHVHAPVYNTHRHGAVEPVSGGPHASQAEGSARPVIRAGVPPGERHPVQAF